MKLKVFSVMMVLAMLLAMVVPAAAAPNAPLGSLVDEVSAEASTYIVIFEDPAVPAYTGGITGYAPTSIAVTGAAKLDINASPVAAYRSYLSRQQANFIAAAEQSLGRDLDVKFQYQLSLNGMAVELTSAEVIALSKMDGVVDIVPDWTEYAQTDVGPGWVQADEIWAGVGDMLGTKGEGMVVGIVDTGINYDHPSFSDDPADYNDGYVYDWDGDYLGWCANSNAGYTQTFECNEKLIGLWSCDEDTPDDYAGHGSHVGSTVAGNYITATVFAPTATVTRSISGVAPHAHVIGFNIEGKQDTGSASGSAVMAATEAAISYGVVDVLNYSFGSSAGDPWISAVHWLNVRKAGIFVATSAGNDGPAAGTAGSPGNAPWMLTVANASHTRKMENSLVDMVEDGPADMTGKGFTSGYGPAEIVYAGWYSDTLIPSGSGTMPMGFENARKCLVPFPAGTFDGEIVVCDRGDNARVAKAENVAAGGAGGFVLANVAVGEFLAGDAYVVPGVHLAVEDGNVLKSWLTETVVQTATITGYTMNIADANADVINSSSSRGPNYIGSIIKPDVAAPGEDILAAVHTNHTTPAANPEFDFYSGTSMASPHAAGVAVLLRKLHPDWTPAELQSAMTSTADNSQVTTDVGDGVATPFDTGAGSLRAANTAQAGLLLDETYENFVAANPSVAGDPTTLNLATLANDACVGECTWERTLKNALDVTATWEIKTVNPTSVTLTTDPVSFTLAPGAEVTVKVMADAKDLPDGTWGFGEVQFTTDITSTVPAHFPVAILPGKTNLPGAVAIETDKVEDSVTLEDIQVLQEVTAMNIRQGMQQAEYSEGYILEDDDQDWISDFFGKPNFGNLMVMTYTVETMGDHNRLVAEIVATTSPDLDLFIIRDSAYYACQSATGATLEYCSIAGSQLVTGTYHVVVHNYAGSGVFYTGTTMLQPDRVVLATGFVSYEDPSELTVTAPDTVALAAPFDVNVAWDVSDFTTNTLGVEPPYRWYGVFDLGKDAASPACIGTTTVDLHYTPAEMHYIYLPIVMRNFVSQTVVMP